MKLISEADTSLHTHVWMAPSQVPGRHAGRGPCSTLKVRKLRLIGKDFPKAAFSVNLELCLGPD